MITLSGSFAGGGGVSLTSSTIGAGFLGGAAFLGCSVGFFDGGGGGWVTFLGGA